MRRGSDFSSRLAIFWEVSSSKSEGNHVKLVKSRKRGSRIFRISKQMFAGRFLEGLQPPNDVEHELFGGFQINHVWNNQSCFWSFGFHFATISRWPVINYPAWRCPRGSASPITSTKKLYIYITHSLPDMEWRDCQILSLIPFLTWSACATSFGCMDGSLIHSMHIINKITMATMDMRLWSHSFRHLYTHTPQFPC